MYCHKDKYVVLLFTACGLDKTGFTAACQYVFVLSNLGVQSSHVSIYDLFATTLCVDAHYLVVNLYIVILADQLKLQSLNQNYKLLNLRFRCAHSNHTLLIFEATYTSVCI